jgi:hypothetical protein
MLELLIVISRALALALRGHRELVLENLGAETAADGSETRDQPPMPASARAAVLDRVDANLADWPTAVVLVRPATVVRWHRDWLRHRWTRRSTPGPNGRPRVNQQIRVLVREMATANPLWGAPRIHGELRTLGIDVSERTRVACAGAVPTSAVADMEDLSRESHRLSRVDGFLHRSHLHRSDTLCPGRAVAPAPAHPASQRYRASHRRMVGATSGRRLSGRDSTDVVTPGSRPHLWRRVPAPRRWYRHR